VLILALLAGCQTPQPRVIEKVVTQPVVVERPVPCIKDTDIPLLPAPLVDAPATANAALSLALAKLDEYVKYGAGSQSIMRNCAKLR
jgi:hypothetical protein